MRIKPLGHYAIVHCGVCAIAAVLVGQLHGQCGFQTAQVTKAKAAVTRTQQAINSLGFKTDSDELTQWGDLSAEKSVELKSAAYKAIVSDVTAGFSNVLKSANQVSTINSLSVNLKNGYLSIGTAQAQGIAARLQKAGLNDVQGRAIQGLVRSLGSTTNKAAKTELAEEIIKGAEEENDSWTIGNDLSENQNTLAKQAELAATVLNIVGVTAPSVALENGEAGAQIIVSLGTSAVSYARINQLSELTQMQLVALKSLTKTLAQQTDALRASNANQQSCLAKAQQTAVEANGFGKANNDRSCMAYKDQCDQACNTSAAPYNGTPCGSVCLMNWYQCRGQSVPASLTKYISDSKAIYACSKAFDSCHDSCAAAHDSQCGYGCVQANTACLAAVSSQSQ